MTWHLPPKSILHKSPQNDEHEEMENAWREAGRIESRCDELGSPLNIEKIEIGPQVVLYYGIPAEKIPVRSLGKLKDEIAYELGAESVSIEAPVAGKKYVGIYCARSQRRMINLGDVI